MRLTGYDNTDANHIGEGIRDEEVYLYQASTGLLTCASCNANGPSVGVLDASLAGEGLGLVGDRRGDWLGEYLCGESSGVDTVGPRRRDPRAAVSLHEGRLFFDSPDELVPQAVNAKEDVYDRAQPGR